MARARKKPASDPDQILVARDSASMDVDGTVYAFQKGVTRIRAGHPAVKANPDLFEPLSVHYEVDQATAEPGSKRGK
jgi:hypothetical protein